jgi:hypothetical protein
VGSPAESPAAPEVLSAVLLDEMHPPSLARRLRDDGHDVVAVLDVKVGLASRSDEDVLAWADRNNRCVVTENVADFQRLASQGLSHGGLVLGQSRRFPRTSSGINRLGDALHALLAAKRLPGRNGVVWLESLPDQ